MGTIVDGFRQAWSATSFEREDLSAYARDNLVGEVRAGLRAMSALLAGLILVAMLAHTRLHLDSHFLYVYALVAVLCVHIFFAAGQVHDVRGLYTLGMALLVIAATALVFVMHRAGVISPLLLGNLLLLFVVIPMVPWGLREATIVTATIWLLLTSSTLSVAARFGADALTLLQLFMLTTAVASLAVVARAVAVRKGELVARHALEAAREDLIRLSNIDPLTGAWNRRYLDEAIADVRQRGGAGGEFHFALFDIDNFKTLNDTFGHAAGDRVLQAFVTTMQHALAQDGHLVRLGGDEFAAVFIASAPEQLIDDAVQASVKAIRDIPELRTAVYGVSHGFASAATDQDVRLAALYRVADRNMYRCKPDGRGNKATNAAIDFEDTGTWMSAQR